MFWLLHHQMIFYTNQKMSWKVVEYQLFAPAESVSFKD